MEERGAGVRRIGGRELEEALRRKIVEEALELLESGDPVEAADLLEAIMAWAEVSGHGWGRIEEERRRKKAARGGFTGGYMVKVCRDPGDPGG